MWGMFKDPDGKPSMMRVSTFLTTVSVLGTFVGHNVMAMIHHEGFVSIGIQECCLLAATLGLKVFQNKFEGITSTDAPVDKK